MNIVTLPNVVTGGKAAGEVYAQHRDITNSELVGYAVLSTDTHGEDPIGFVGRDAFANDIVFSPTEYATALACATEADMYEQDSALQFHEPVRYVHRVVAVYNYNGTPTIVL